MPRSGSLKHVTKMEYRRLSFPLPRRFTVIQKRFPSPRHLHRSPSTPTAAPSWPSNGCCGTYQIALPTTHPCAIYRSVSLAAPPCRAGCICANRNQIQNPRDHGHLQRAVRGSAGTACGGRRQISRGW